MAIRKRWDQAKGKGGGAGTELHLSFFERVQKIPRDSVQVDAKRCELREGREWRRRRRRRSEQEWRRGGGEDGSEFRHVISEIEF